MIQHIFIPMYKNYKNKIINVLLIILPILCLLFGFGYINSLVSYKYEVEDSLLSNTPLTTYQKDIVDGIFINKILTIITFILLIILIIKKFIYVPKKERTS